MKYLEYSKIIESGRVVVVAVGWGSRESMGSCCLA